jgi:hypothetical protein
VEIMSHSVGWHLTISSLQKAGKEGRDAIRTTVLELLECGYLERVQGRVEGGVFGEVEYALCIPKLVGKSVSGELFDPSIYADTTADGFSGSGGSTGSGSTDVGSADDGESDTKKNISLEDHLVEDQTPPAAASRKKPKTAIPAGWMPNEACTEYARTNALDLGHEASQFRASAEANDRRYSNWDQAFRTWLGNQVSWRRPSQPALVNTEAWMDAS